MKEQFLLYGICFAISFGAVAVTSFIKQIITCISKKCGHDMSGNVKEYIFAPMAILIAAAGLYLWLDKFIKMTFDEKFILILTCFSVGTMLLYLILFQPTRKFVVKIIRSIMQHFNVPAVVEVVKDVLSEAEIFLGVSDADLQSNAEQDDIVLEVEEKPPDDKQADTEGNLCGISIDPEADKLRLMVEKIKNNIK